LTRTGVVGGWLLGLALAGAVAGCATPRGGPIVAPDARPTVTETGLASWYGAPHQGRRTASGETFDMYRLTAAHPALPLGTRVLVTNLRNGRSVEVRVNDRGPTVAGRIIDVSYAAARKLGAAIDGVFPVRLRVLSWPSR
jgi:rare lipoprotein A